MDQRVRRATPLISTQQFPTVSLSLPAQIDRKANAFLILEMEWGVALSKPLRHAVMMAGAGASSVAEGRS